VKRFAVLACIIAWGAWAGVAQAEDFDRGSWKLQLTGSYIHSENAGFDDHRVRGGQATAGVGYYFLDNLGGYFDLVGYGLTQDEPDVDAWGAGFNLMLRWHFLRGERWSIFADGGAGLVQFDRRFPAGGTHFNFNQRVGLGATFRLDANIHLIGGVRYMHLSNASIHGSGRNPSFDAVEAYVGLMFSL
jgi:hypothetical protein